MEPFVDDELSEKPLKYYWNLYTTTAIRTEKSRYLDAFLEEFLKTYSLVRGNVSKMPVFGDLHSVSNMLAREFQTIILAKCTSEEDNQEQNLVGYLCHGSGLMLLEVLCILAYKIAGCSSELANLIVTLLPVLLQVPSHENDSLQVFQTVKLDYDNYFQDPKSKPHHVTVVQELILKHCSHHALHNKQVFNFDTKNSLDKNQEPALTVPSQDHTDSSTEESDILTSISSMGSMGLHSSNEETTLELHRQSSGISSLLENTDIPTPFEKTPINQGTPTETGQETPSEIIVSDDTATPCAETYQDVSINSFELLLLMLTVLENLCCRDSSSYDTSLTVKTCGQLIDLIACLHEENKDEQDLEVVWDLVSTISVRLFLLRTVYFFMYATFRNPKSAKQLVKSSYVTKLVEFVENEIPSATMTAKQAEDLMNELPPANNSCLWQKFHHVLFVSLAFRGLVVFISSCLQFGSLINSSLLALSREFLEQFTNSGGFHHLVTIALKYEELEVALHSERLPDNQLSVVAVVIRTLPKDTTLHVLSLAGKLISLLKRGKIHCRGEVDSPNNRKSIGSYLQFQPPSDSMTSDVDESSESAGDMENENERRSRDIVHQCQILPIVTASLNIFKNSQTHYLSSSILSCLAKVGICGCIQPNDLVTPLLTRFLLQPRPLQTQILQLVNQLIIASLDDAILSKTTQEQYSTRPRSKSKRMYSKSPKTGSGSKRSSVMPDNEILSCSSHVPRRPQEEDYWSCLSQFCTFLTSGDQWLALETAKSMKTLVLLGSSNLKNELFRVVLLPSLFRFDLHRKSSKNEDAASTPTNMSSPLSGFYRERSQTLRPSSASVNKDVLTVLLGYLPSLLVSQTSRSLFFSCGGLSELQVFLDVVELQELVVGVFEYLASLEDCARDDSIKDSQQIDNNQINQESASAVKNFLTLLKYTANVGLFKPANSDATESSEQEKCSEITQSEESVESSEDDHTLNDLSLCLHVWKACLNLLVSNKVFVESFIADQGPVYSIDLLKWMINYFSSPVEQNEDVYSETVALFEVIVAVCIRVSYAGLTQDVENVPGVCAILHDSEQIVLHSNILKKTLGRGLCDSFTKAAVKRLYLKMFPNQQENSDVLEKELMPINPEGELTQLMFDDDLDSPALPKKSVEDGYEADNEVNTDSSDDSDAKTISRQTSLPKKQTSREARQTTDKSTVDFQGLVGYPQICRFLFTLLEAAYGGETCKPASKSLSVLTHAAQSLISLVKDCEHNCRVLCDEGLLGAILNCYKNVLCSDDSHLRGLQTIVINLLVILASQQIKASELKDFIRLFKNKSIPVDLLCSGLAQIASKACISQGPAFIFTFPCRLQTVDSRLKNTGKKTKSQRLRQEAMMKRNKGGSLHSPGDASSEGCSTEGSWSKVKHSPECSERHRRGKPQSKLTRGMKARNDSDNKDRGDSLQAEDSADLPSPFSIKAVNLRCHGNQPWPVSELSVAFWVRVHNQKKFPDAEVSHDRFGLVSTRPNSEWTGTRSDSMSCDDAVHVCSFGSRKCLFEVWLFPSNASFLLRWTKSSKGSTDGYDVVKELVTRHTSFTRGRWHHVVISLYQSKQKSNETVIDRNDSCKILLIVDGTDVTEHSFGPPVHNNDEKCSLSVALLGHVILTSSKREGSGEEKEVLPDGYDVGCVMLFTAPVSKGSKKRHVVDWLVGKDEAFYLYSLGPNAVSVGHLQNDFELMTSNNPSQSCLVASKLWSRLSISERSVASELKTGYLTSPFMIIPDIESSLRGHLFLSYSPKNPSLFSQAVRLPNIDDKSRRTSQYDTRPPITSSMVQNEAKLFHEVKTSRVITLLEAAYDVGGMTVFIYLFGKVVEMTNDHKTQADALSVVLSLQRNCEYHACAMYHQAGYALLKRILLTPQCMVGYHMLKVLMEAACDGDVFKQTNLSDNPIMLNIDSNAVVRNVDIFQHYLLNWKIWDKAKQGVFEMLLSTLEILVHASHPHYKFNISQFQKAELVQQLLIGCQERLGEGFTEIPSSISTLYVNIIQNIMGNPPDLTVLKAVCEFLIAMHPTEETTRLHSPTRFYLTERSFKFDCRIPAVTRQPLLPSSLSAPILAIKKQSPIPTSSPVPVSNPVPKSSPVQASSPVPKSSPINSSDLASTSSPGKISNCVVPSSESPASSNVTSICNSTNDELRDVSNAIPVVEDEKRHAETQSERKISPSSAHNTLSSSQEPESVHFIGPHFASCPQPFVHKKLTVQIPSRTPPTAKPVYGSADGASILLQNSPLRERNSYFSSPSAPPTPRTPAGEPYTGPGSKPMSISNQSATPQSAGMTSSSVDVMEYDFINESDFSSLKGSLANQSSVDEYLVVEGYPGIKSSTGTYKPGNKHDRRKHVTDHMTKMRLGLLKLLQKVLLNLQAEQIPAVVGGVLKVEYLLVWVSHQSPLVRELVIKILCLYLQKAESERYNHFVDIRGFHLLANQIYDHEVTKGTIEALLWLLVGRPVDLEKDYAYSTSMDQCLLSSVRALGVVPLLSILEDTLVSQHLHHMLVKHICQLFLKVDELSLKAVAHGLLYTVCNVIIRLANIHHQQSKSEDDSIVDVNALMDDIQSLIASVVIRACSTCGSLYFQMFEDLLVVLGNLEERDHKRREYDLSIFFIARYLRYFAIQVALHFFHEICKDEHPGGGRRKKSTGMRFPFRGGEKCADHNPFKPVSSWVTLSHDHNMPCSDLGLLKNTPTSANFNEQTQRFQSVLQIAVNCVIYSRTFLCNDLSPLQFYAADLQIHDCLKQEMIKGPVTGVNIEKEFAQFVFSLLFESMDMFLDGKGTLPSKVLFVSKDVIKSQLAKLLVFLLSPSQPLDLSCFAVQIANHPQAKKLLQNLLSGNWGGKVRDKLLVYLPMMVSDDNLTESQTATAMDFKSLLESCGLKFSPMEEITSKSEMEVQIWDQTDTTNIMEWHKKRLEAFKVLSQRIEALSVQVSRSAMDVTRVAVEIQDSQRQTLLKHNRDALSAEVQVRKKWRQLIERLIHERSIWYDRGFFPKSWRLDPTEGPLRVRCRMQRFHLDVPVKHVMQEHRKNGTVKCSSPLAYLFEDSTSSHRKNVYYIFDTPDTIRFLYHCRHILLDIKTKGVILIGESHMYFIGEEATTADTDVTQILLGNKDAISISWLIKEIQEIRTRRYCLQDIGVEVFLTNGRTYFLAFDTENDRDIILDQFKQRMLPIYETPATENIHNTTMLWRTGNLSNFEYLTELNKEAGRTFNDLMQYPVFPFILSDFSSEVLDLNDTNVFRDLSKPIAAQNYSKEMNYRERFRWLKEEYDRSGQDDPLTAPYHYGSHYSNSGTVLHFLVRLPPFTKMFLQYQDRSFDIPDRTFHSMATTWRLSSYESSTDVKELIPEFFFLPEFLENFEGFDFGLRQCGDRVMDVTLPPWAKGNARLFILVHRQALETEQVTRFLHKWIDLVFGYKQTGPEAIEAINVFHPATYYGVQVNSITDPIRQKALKTMIETYGQTPRQLFAYPHSPQVIRKNLTTSSDSSSVTTLPAASKYDVDTISSTTTFINRFHQSFSSENTLTGTVETFADVPKPASTVEGLRWGQYVCSPSLPVPSITLNHTVNVPGTLLVCERLDRVHVLCRQTTLMSVYDDRNDRFVFTAVLSWSSLDSSLMVFPEGSGPGIWLMDVKTPDKVTSCAINNDCTSLFIGTSSGVLSYLPIKYNPSLDCKIELQGSLVHLYGHSQVVTCLHICHEYSVLVSGSQDGTAIIWDICRLSYIRTLEHTTAVHTLAVSRRSGDVATVSHQDTNINEDDSYHENQGSMLYLWTVNGRPVAHTKCDHMISCVDFSRAPEGVSVNVIATGLSNGAIRLWSTWDLQHIRDIAPEQNIYPIISVAFSEDSQRLFALNNQSRLIMWQRKDKIIPRPPSIITFPSSHVGPRATQDGRIRTET